MASTRWQSLALLVTIWLLALGCERDDPSDPPTPSDVDAGRMVGFVLGQVSTRESGESQRPVEGLEAAEIGLQFRRALRDLPMFFEEGQRPPAGTLGPTISFRLESGAGFSRQAPREQSSGTGMGSGDGQYIVLMLRAFGEAEDDRRFEFEVNGLYRERLAPGEEPLAAANRAMGIAIDELVSEIRDDAAPRVASDADLLLLLSGEDAERILPALREVYRRRLTAAASALRALLTFDDPEVALAAATGLGRIRDLDAVGPLIDMISRDQRELTEIVLPILGEIGTRDARLYLETVADGHVEPRIRRIARNVLDRMHDSTR